MDVAKLGQRQLFGMKKDTLLKRITRFFQQTQQAAEVVEYLVAILFRHSICVGDFSLQPLNELIQQIFLNTPPNDTLRRHCLYFQHFFSAEEWQTVTQRLFANEEEYQHFTKETRFYKKLLEKKDLETSHESEFQFDLVSIFKDANGKRHTWTLRNTKQVHSEEETAEILGILTTLTIFQASGVRRFAEYVKFKSKKGCIDAEHEALQAEPEELVQQAVEDTSRKEKKQPERITPAANTSISNAPEKNQAPSSANQTHSHTRTQQETKAKADTTAPIPGNVPTAEPENQAAPSPTAKTKKSAAPPENTDDTDLRYGKSKEQIQQERDERAWRNKLNKILKRRK